jgi:phage/plasmid-like protein (TIGR03299 family)
MKPVTNYYDSNVQTKMKILKRFSMFDGVGFDLTKAKSYGDALDMAGLDYSATKVPIFTESGKEIENHFGVAKSDDPERILGIVGNQYHAVSNRAAFEVAEDIVNGGYANYEVGGPSMKSGYAVDFARSFLVLRGDDFQIEDDMFNSFVVFNNSFDGSTGVQYQVVCQRVVCMNGMVRYLGGKESQFKINIQHTQSAQDRIKMAKKIILKREDDIELIKKEAQLFMNVMFSREEFEKEIIPLILMKKGLVEKDKDRERGQERVEQVVGDILQAYNADDVQNYASSAYRIILALSDYESHSEPLRNTGNGQIYMNRILKGMVLTTAAAQYIANTRGIKMI